jgi:phospholipid/cholesterol/gamma-HCH transport system substrate-binding protein
MSTLAAGSVALVVIVLFTYLGFTKFANPFATPYTVHMIVPNANGLSPAAWVRIAGVNVGKVESIQPAGNCKSTGQTPTQCAAADVTITIQNQGLPIHKDATFAIRPRIFLEGNFFVDLHPGTPEAPIAPSGYVFPVQATTDPVQFDQVLTSLQSDTRRNLQILLQQYGVAVKKGGPSYSKSIQYWLPAYKYSSIVAHDSLGIQTHDLSNALYKGGDVSAALSTHPKNLENLVTDFNITANAFARQSANLQRAVAELPTTLHVAIPALNSLNSAFCSGPAVPNCAPGPLRQLAKALIPATTSTGTMATASLPFISQLRQLVQPSELGGLSTDLKNTIPSLTQLTKETIPLLRNQVRPASSCVANNVIPWSHLTLQDPNFNAKNGFPPHPVYVEAGDFLPGLAGESRDFDANGMFIRVLGALGNTGVTSLQSGLVGGALAPLVGAQPQKPATGEQPPTFQPNVPCETQPPVTDLSAPSTPAPQTLSPTGLLPSALTQLLQNLPIPKIPGAPAGLSTDTAKSKKKATPLTAAQRASDMKQLQKTGVFEIVPPKSSKSTAAATSSPISTKKSSAQ